MPQKIILALSASLALTACGNQTAAPTNDNAADANDVLIINDSGYSRVEFDNAVRFVTQGREFDTLPPSQQDAVVENLVELELLAQQARDNGLTDDPEIAAQLRVAEDQLLARHMLTKLVSEHQPAEADLRAAFDAEQANASPVTQIGEYRARHILVDSEEKALELQAQLATGADFSALAKEHSSDSGSAVQGGDLGWFPPHAMVKPFSDAVVALKKGERTGAPVQSKFGWHLIQLDDTRAMQAPTFDDRREDLANQQRRELIETTIADLKANATVVNKLKDEPVEPQADQGALSKLQDAASKAGEAVTDAAGSAVDATKDAASKAGEMTKDAAAKAGEMTKDAANATMDAAKSAADATAEAASNAADKAKEMAGAATQSVKETAAEVTEAAKDAVSSDEPAEEAATE